MNNENKQPEETTKKTGFKINFHIVIIAAILLIAAFSVYRLNRHCR